MTRVVWLRAHARACRFEEEVVIVDAEMKRTENTLLYEKNQWITRSAGDITPGQRNWAKRQASLWNALHSHAAEQFRLARQKHQPPPVYT